MRQMDPSDAEFEAAIERVYQAVLARIKEDLKMPDSIICKVNAGSVMKNAWATPENPSEIANLYGVYESEPERNPENYRFSKASPSISINIQIDNPGAQGFLQQNKQYYCVFIPAEVGEAAAVQAAQTAVETVRAQSVGAGSEPGE